MTSLLGALGGKETDYETIGHAAVMIGYTNQGIIQQIQFYKKVKNLLKDRKLSHGVNKIFNRHNLKLTIRNSLAGQTVFGRKQPGEHEIEGEITNKMNEWNLAHENCYYFEFA